MRVEVAHKPADQLVPTPIVQQTAFWGRVHRRLGFGVDAFDLRLAAPGETAARGDFLVVKVQLADGVECAYVPHGPELAPASDAVGPFLERLSRELRPRMGPRCAFVRWDLPWTSVHAREDADFADDGSWHGPPAAHLRELRMNIGTDDRNLYKAPRDLLPSDTLVVDLADEDTMLARMHHKTRYNLRLAARRGVVVTEGCAADLPAWYALYLETAARNHLEPMPLEHFTTMMSEGGEGSASPVATRLLLARHHGELLAGALVAIAPPRAIYLYGASNRSRPEVMAPYAVQWEAMRLAQAGGCTEYDLFGAAPRDDQHHSLAGVHRFKVGFGGRLVHREGCWDYPFDDDTYQAIRHHEASHVLQRAVAPGS